MISRHSRTVVVLLAAVVCLSTTHASAQSTQLGLLPRLDTALAPQTLLRGGSRVRVIVSAKSGLLGQLRLALRLLPVTVLDELPLIDAVVVELPAVLVDLLAALPVVQSLSLDAVVKPTAGASTEAYSVPAAVGVTPGTSDGTGVGVAVIDSGIAPHADLLPRLAASLDFRGAASGAAVAPSDPYGHGTHVAGLVASVGRYAVSPAGRGTAPGARLVSMRVLEADGSGYTSDVIEAIEYAAVNRVRLGISVLNLSLGHPVYEPAGRDPLVRAVQAAVRSGLVVVVSAGNFGINPRTGEPGYAGISSPGNAPSAITVGALDTRRTLAQGDDQVATYSSRGPSWYDGYAKPDVVAPGHRLVSTASAGSTLFSQAPSGVFGTGATAYQTLSGTSMAAPVVAGVVASMISANRQAYPGEPDLTPNALKGFLQFSAVPVRGSYGEPADPLTEGAGGLNAAGAIELAQMARPSAPVGSSWLSGAPSLMSWLGGDPVPWKGTIVWATTGIAGRLIDLRPGSFDNGSVWGSARPSFKNVVWSDDYVWNDNSSATNVVWSDDAVQGDESVGTRNSAGGVEWGSATTPDTTVWAPATRRSLLNVLLSALF